MRLRRYPDDDKILAVLREKGGEIRSTAEAFDIPERSFGDHLRRRGLMSSVNKIREEVAKATSNDDVLIELDTNLEELHKLISKKNPPSVEELADHFDVAPKNIRGMCSELQERGFRVANLDSGRVSLQKIAPDKQNVHKSLLEGEEIKIGLVSDTHLSSNEQALDHLELAYDVFAEEGITEVYHAGDFTSGVGIFPQQHSAIFNHTYEDQVEYLVNHYPSRPGITTRGITGNHDIEGGFGRIGANPVVALANCREDIDFLGDYSAWVELPGGAYLHLLHGKGSMSYAYSYKAQKLVDGYPSGRKPAILAVGHWHVHGTLEHRSVQVVFPGCFEWQSQFMQRLALTPAVGFHILHATIGDDGSLVKFIPEWHRFYEGRVSND
jgi:predicted phosphodiesterase